MAKNKIQTRTFIKIVATILTTIILLQICSPIALGIKETENLQKQRNTQKYYLSRPACEVRYDFEKIQM